MRSIVALASSALLSSCFSYVASSPGTVGAGEEVRVQVSRTALSQLPAEVAASGPTYDGTLVAESPDGITLQVTLMRRPDAFYGPAASTDVRLAAGDIVQLERKELDVRATALLVGGAVAVTAVALRAFVFGGSGRPGDPDPGPELIRIPLFSIPRP